MKRLLFILLAGCCFSAFSNPGPQTPFSDEVDSLICLGIEQTFYCEFDHAMETFQRVMDLHPDHLVGYFYMAATLQSKMMDLECTYWKDDFYLYADRAISIGRAMIASGDEDPWTRFYLGSAISYKGLFMAKSGQIIPGIKRARKGLSFLREAVDMDTTLYDAYLGLGNYAYWSGKFYKYLKWLPWISDQRDEGVEMVQRAIRRGSFSYWVGLNSLGWIEYDRKNYKESLDIFKRGLKKYPDSRFFLWGVGSNYLKMERYSDAIPLYQRLLEMIRGAEVNNGYNEVECLSKLAVACYETGAFEDALHYCLAIENRKIDETLRKRLSEQYEIAETYRFKSSEALGRVTRIDAR